MRDPEARDRIELPLLLEEGARKPRPVFWRRLSRVMEAVIYVLLVLAVAKLFVPELERRDELEAENRRLASIRGEKDAHVVRLRQEYRLLKTDKTYLETVARDRLNLQREDEHIIRIERGDEE